MVSGEKYQMAERKESSKKTKHKNSGDIWCTANNSTAIDDP